MDNINKLVEIAEYLGLTDVVNQLQNIDMRSHQDNATLVMPLVGEFSSGKTTLINALTDSRKLETATKPTTSTIYEIHFNSDKCRATILDENGHFSEVSDLSDLKNDNLTDAKVVTVFDTSKKIPASTILVDTPGLSSTEPKHRQTLVDFLPKADGILLVTDINQQITRSLTDFIETMKLSMRPIFLVITKSDTKYAGDIESTKKYISENCKIPLKQIAVVSAAKNDVNEFLQLLDNVQKNKKEIIKKIDSQRIKNIVDGLLKHVNELMKASASDKELDEALRVSKYELDKVYRNIDRLTESIADDIEEQKRLTSRRFEDTVSEKLNALVTGKSSNFDWEATSMVNSTAALLLNDYSCNIKNILREKARGQKGKDSEVYLDSIDNIDMSCVQMSEFNCNLGLNAMGHEYDGWIKTGVIAVAAVGAVGIVAAGGAAAGTAAIGSSTVATTGGRIATAATIGNVVDVADTVSDVGSIISNRRTLNRIEKASGLITSAKDKYGNISSADQQLAEQTGSKKGLIESVVGLATDKLMGKPQRVRATRNYIDSSLSPEFKMQMNDISSQLVSCVKCNLQNQASQVIEQKTESLNQLKMEMKEKKEIFNERMSKLREFNTILLTY